LGRGLATLAVGGTPDDALEEFGDGAAQAAQATRRSMGGLGECEQTDNQAEPTRTERTTETRQRQNESDSRYKRASLTIATLNMKGQYTRDENGVRVSKWADVHHMMKAKKIGILALQETHLKEADEDSIMNLYGRRLEVTNSALEDPDRATRSAGVAFVINKDVADATKWTAWEIIPGRAMLLDITWRHEQRMKILNIYAYNESERHEEMWGIVTAWTDAKPDLKPDIVLGDFNMVEDASDRAPKAAPPKRALNALYGMKTAYNVLDGWRFAYQNKRVFTFQDRSHAQKTMARLDRIYVRTTQAKDYFGWKIGIPTVKTDHNMVLVRYAPATSPEIGKGRWTWPAAFIGDREVLEMVERTARILRNEMRNDNQRAQEPDEEPDRVLTLWQWFKDTIREGAQTILKRRVGKIRAKIASLDRKMLEIENSPELDEDAELRASFEALHEEREYLGKKVRASSNEKERASWVINGEKITPYWMAVNKARKPKDYINRLQIKGTRPLAYETNSKRMAEIARNHYDKVQRPDDERNLNEARRNQRRTAAMASIPEERKLRSGDQAKLSGAITSDEVLAAIRAAPGCKATGLDGIPYEIYKFLTNEKAHAEDKALEEELRGPLNFGDTLARVFQQIQTQGLRRDSQFNDGWLCPLYKKNDATDPANYRPITLLNAEYKLMTRILSERLSKVVSHMVDEDQAGFIPKRSILDHVRLSKAMVDLAEATEEDGVIVALDQEKAYDRIKHDYLWQVMREFRIPEDFINTVKTLYTNANTVIILNGEQSSPLTVTRGVRQGDPLSCLLFDIAIEPLACLLRSDTRLTRFRVPGTAKKLIVNLFADDTLVYLNKTDRFSDLKRVLDMWCLASGARFNQGKTEFIPIGSPEHRDRVVEQRRWNELDDELPRDARIANDGQMVRSLGAMIGNEISESTAWAVTLDKVQAALDRWNRGHPTLDARKLIVQLVVGGYTQYFTAVQGMPKETEDRFIKMIRAFMWADNSRPLIGLEHLYEPKERGGLGLLDIKARNEAIRLMQLQSYLKTGDDRPTWAFAWDTIIAKVCGWDCTTDGYMNVLLHSKKIPESGPRASRLPDDIKRTMKLAKVYGVTIAAIQLSEGIKKQFPAWTHIAAQGWTYSEVHDKCLRSNHSVRTCGDLLKVANAAQNERTRGLHVERPTCACRTCIELREKGCCHPIKCMGRARKILDKLPDKFKLTSRLPTDGLSLTHRRREKNRQNATRRTDEIIFDPSIAAKTSLAECFRIFVSKERLDMAPAHRLEAPARGRNVNEEHCMIYTDGSCLNNGQVDARCGAGVWYGEEDERNRAIRVPGRVQSNQVGELAAAVVALQDTPTHVPITIVTDSEYVLKGFTQNLKKWEDAGYTGIENQEWFQAGAYLLRRRSAQTAFRWIKGHSGDAGNEGADKLARQGADKDEVDVIDLRVPAAFDIQGAKMETLTQRVAYKGIRERQPRPTRKRTRLRIQEAMERTTVGPWIPATEAQIWKGMRANTIRPNVGQYLFRVAHDTYMLGEMWLETKNPERARCSRCGNGNETMEHILLDCPAHERDALWKLAEGAWVGQGLEWPEVSMGLIVACGAIRIRPEATDGTDRSKWARTAAAASWRLQIFISETAHLIWAMRCERVIQGKASSTRSAKARWWAKMNVRLRTDRSVAHRSPRKKKDISKMAAIWRPLVDRLGTCNDTTYDEDWLTTPGVFSGYKLSPTLLDIPSSRVSA
jgi:ribonuclease HI/endonuclease/exonuclease/phosphatase family metal-dependent hydrolase